jgi:hypothetical protein
MRTKFLIYKMKVFEFYFLQEKEKNPPLHEKIKIDEV